MKICYYFEIEIEHLMRLEMPIEALESNIKKLLDMTYWHKKPCWEIKDNGAESNYKQYQLQW